jgi:hypothetical protein
MRATPALTKGGSIGYAKCEVIDRCGPARRRLPTSGGSINIGAISDRQNANLAVRPGFAVMSFSTVL